MTRQLFNAACIAASLAFAIAAAVFLSHVVARALAPITNAIAIAIESSDTMGQLK